MPAFQPGDRVRSTLPAEDLVTGYELPEPFRRVPFVGTIVAAEGDDAAHPEDRRWIVALDDLDARIPVAETALMPMRA